MAKEKEILWGAQFLKEPAPKHSDVIHFEKLPNIDMLAEARKAIGEAMAPLVAEAEAKAFKDYFGSARMPDFPAFEYEDNPSRSFMEAIEEEDAEAEEMEDSEEDGDDEDE